MSETKSPTQSERRGASTRPDTANKGVSLRLRKHEAEHDLYRFPDGEFAFSREYANERRLRRMGLIG
jgi:hypothetical protein